MRLDPDDVLPGLLTPFFRKFETASLEDLMHISALLGFVVAKRFGDAGLSMCVGKLCEAVVDIDPKGDAR